MRNLLAMCLIGAVLISKATVALLVSLLFLLLIILGLMAYFAGMRRDLMKMKNGIERSFTEIDALLKQRHNELPKLLETCRPYIQQEEKTLQSLVEARAAYTHATTVSQKAQADRMVRGALRNLFAVAANSPDLKRNTSFVRLQTRLAQVEESLAAQSDRYNQDVHNFNTRIARIPTVYVARLVKLRPPALFQA